MLSYLLKRFTIVEKNLSLRNLKLLKIYISDVVELQRGEFRQATEDRHTHLYQNPWYVL